MDELQQIRHKNLDGRPKFTSKLLQLALMLRYSSLPAYPCKYAGPMRIFISKSDRHERVAADNVMKCNDLPLLFLCDNHLENKFIISTSCNVYFNNAQKLVNSQVRREVVQQFKKWQRKPPQVLTHDWNKTLRLQYCLCSSNLESGTMLNIVFT